MGQQQLLLVILVTIIVGIATVVAINTFSSAADSANVDAVRQDVATIASSAQGYYMKPGGLGGGGQDFTDITFDDVSFASEGVSGDALTAWNQNGTYVISGQGSNDFTVTAYPSSCYADDAGDLPVTSCADNDELTATISADDLSWTN